MKHGKTIVIRPEACTYSALCEDVCPTGAIELPYLVCMRPVWHTDPRMKVAQSTKELDVTDYAYQPDLVSLLSEIPQDSIVSRTIHASSDLKAVLFGFDAGQELSEHTASQPATLIFLQGEASVTLGDDQFEARAGTWVHMPPHLPHSIVARTPLIMLLHLVRPGADKEADS